jgi:hypothetical protein
VPEKRYSKVEEEIIQILDRLEHEEPAGVRPTLRLVPSRPARRARWKPGRSRITRPGTLPSWTWIALAFALALGAYLLQDVSRTLTLLLAIGSMLAFVWPLLARFRGGPPSGPASTTKTWRGKDITFSPPPGQSSAERARRWLDDRRGGPRRFR